MLAVSSAAVVVHNIASTASTPLETHIHKARKKFTVLLFGFDLCAVHSGLSLVLFVRFHYDGQMFPSLR